MTRRISRFRSVTLAFSRAVLVTWLRNLFSWTALQTMMSTWGALWLLVQAVRFFFDETTLPKVFHDLFYFLLIAGVAAAVFRCRPCLCVAHKLNGRDVTIEIAIGDIFSFSGSIVVSSNTTFDTRLSNTLIDARSVQGQFTLRHYQGEDQLDAELAAGLAHIPHVALRPPRPGKLRKFPIGTVVRVNPPNRTGYFLAVAHINEHGTASGTFEELKDALTELWAFIASHGPKGPIVIPVIGTGFCRLVQTREEVVHEIIQSFVAACTASTFADRLTIVIFPRDVIAHRMSFDRLGNYLSHVCEYTRFSRNDRVAVGTAIQSTGVTNVPVAGVEDNGLPELDGVPHDGARVATIPAG